MCPPFRDCIWFKRGDKAKISRHPSQSVVFWQKQIEWGQYHRHVVGWWWKKRHLGRSRGWDGSLTKGFISTCNVTPQTANTAVRQGVARRRQGIPNSYSSNCHTSGGFRCVCVCVYIHYTCRVGREVRRVFHNTSFSYVWAARVDGLKCKIIIHGAWTGRLFRLLALLNSARLFSEPYKISKALLQHIFCSTPVTHLQQRGSRSYAHIEWLARYPMQ